MVVGGRHGVSEFECADGKIPRLPLGWSPPEPPRRFSLPFESHAEPNLRIGPKVLSGFPASEVYGHKIDCLLSLLPEAFRHCLEPGRISNYARTRTLKPC